MSASASTSAASTVATSPAISDDEREAAEALIPVVMPPRDSNLLALAIVPAIVPVPIVVAVVPGNRPRRRLATVFVEVQ